MIHLLIATALVLSVADPHTDDALRREVSQLIRQLDARQLTERDAAERKLLSLGPEVLARLPAIDGATPPEVALRVGRLRNQLLRAQAISASQPSSVTLRGENLTLEEVLAEISRQTGNPISDHRAAFGQRQDAVRVNAKFDKTPFWQAVDNVLDQAGLSLYGFTGERGAFVIKRPPDAGKRAAKASYAGVFRLDPLRFEAQRDLRNARLGALRFVMEVSWEPRLRPFAILQPLADVSAVGNLGESIEPLNRRAEPETLIRDGFSTTELEIPFSLPRRGTERIGVLKGKLLALVPGPLADFRFDELPLANGNAPPPAIASRQGTTTVTLESVRQNNEVWEASVRVKLEAPTTALESHRGWILNNEAFFEDRQGHRVNAGGLEQSLRTKQEIGVKYFFDLPRGAEELSFVYRTPLVVLELPVEYEFRDLPLP